MFFHDGSLREITRKNLASSWRLIAPKKVLERECREEIPRKKRTSFDIMKTERPCKKGRKRGFIRTEAANEAMERLYHI
jgi:hypothetical protein